jgi:tetratricopeptide (TPR) repeat protein
MWGCIGSLWGAAPLTEGAKSLDASPSEDALIMQAVLDEGDGNYTASRDLYTKLFTLTGNKEYLIREAQDALAEQKNPSRSISNLTHWVTQHPTDHDKKLYLILAALYIQTHALADADEIVDAYLTQGDMDPLDLQEFGALKIQLGEYGAALKLLKKAYAQSPDEQTALQIAALYLLKLQQPQRAIAMLEKHLAGDPNVSIGFYFKLIELYAKENRLDKVLALYKKLYLRDPQNYFLQKIIEISIYRKDPEGLIRFLEKTKGNETLLYKIYKENGFFDKASALAVKLYEKTAKPKWLAERAVLLYEQAQKAHQVTPELLEKMSKLFEKSFANGGGEGMYLNYYGYTLIDHDMDIDKGIGLVRRALGQDPNNAFFLDSLAWGLYKKGQCKKADFLMRRVVKKEGLKEPEIQDHYKAIKACLKHK